MRVFVLPHDEFVFAEVGDVVHWRLRIEFEQKPADVCPEETFRNVVGIFVVVDVFVVAAMVGGPVQAGVFKGAGAEKQSKEFHRSLRFERKMGEKTVITDSNAHHRRAEVEEEHAELEPIDPEMVEIDWRANECDECGANEEAGGNPVHTVKRNAKHNIFKFWLSAGWGFEKLPSQLNLQIAHNYLTRKERFFCKKLPKY